MILVHLVLLDFKKNNRFYGAIRVDGVPTFNVNELR